MQRQIVPDVTGAYRIVPSQRFADDIMLESFKKYLNVIIFIISV